MDDNFKNYIIYAIIIIIIIIIIYFIINTISTKVYLQQNINKQHDSILKLKEELCQIKNSLNNVVDGNNEDADSYYPPLNRFDPVLEYDMQKLYDPLVDPSQRYVVSQLPTPQIASVTNIATQNIYDSYHRVGLLIAEKCDNESVVPENQVLELFSRMLYQYFYQYYTAITMGQKIIKVNINRDSGQEYYNGNIIYIPELRTKYRVQIDVRDQIYYNPYFQNPV